jgi:hypothetical protein
MTIGTSAVSVQERAPVVREMKVVENPGVVRDPRLDRRRGRCSPKSRWAGSDLQMVVAKLRPPVNVTGMVPVFYFDARRHAGRRRT